MASDARPAFPDFLPTVPGLLRASRTRFSDNECVVTPSSRLTFTELDDRSAKLAARLVEAGVGKGSRVGLLFPNGVDWVIAFAAAARLGAITMPVNTFYQTPELARFMRHADVQYLLGVPEFLHHDYVAGLEAIAPELAGHGPGRLHLPSLPQLRRVLLWGESSPEWAEPDPPDRGTAPALAAVVRAMGDDVTPADELLVTYTSGSTGEPKGVVLSHGAVLRHASNLAVLSGFDESSRVWTTMPLFWTGGFLYGLLRAIVAGGCFVTQDVFEPGAALRLISQERVTDVAGWPHVIRALSEHPDFARTDLRSMRSGLYDAIRPDRRPPDPGLVVSSLGMSETCGPHTFKAAEGEMIGAPERYRGTYGHQVPALEHRIVDPETGRDVPDGEEGEVLVRGYSLMLGLYKRERSEVFDGDGWYHTGDRGYFRDGWFFFTGRQSDVIKTGGANVAPAEVEQCLMAYDDVEQAFVVGVPDEVRGQEVVALVVPSTAVDGESLRVRLQGELSSYKVPRHVLVIADHQVPWMVSQKVDRRALVTLAEKLLSDGS